MAARHTWLVMAVIAVCMTGCRPGPPSHAERPALPLILASVATPYSGLIAIAETQGYFEKVGLDLTVRLYPSGLDALTAMRRGDAGAATVADIAFAVAMAEDPSLRVLAGIGASSGSEMVARKDRGIHSPSDLRGKRVGYSPGSSSAYYLHSFLLTNRLSRQDITAVPVVASRQVETVISGEVDAVAAIDIYAFAAKKALGANAIAWDIQNTLDYQWLLATRTLEARPREAIERFLSALVMAEEFAVNHEEETKSILVEHWGIDADFIRYSWSRTRLSVSFNQSIVTALQTYLQWHAGAGGRAGVSPDVIRHLDIGPLEAVDSRLVTVFR